MSATDPEPRLHKGVPSDYALRAVNPKDPTLVESIKNYIDLRDRLWVDLANSAVIAERDLGILQTANDALSAMLSLTPGPNTPVLEPLVARLELARCKICSCFIARAAVETLHLKQHGNSAVVSAAKLFLAEHDDPAPPRAQLLEGARLGYGG